MRNFIDTGGPAGGRRLWRAHLWVGKGQDIYEERGNRLLTRSRALPGARASDESTDEGSQCKADEKPNGRPFDADSRRCGRVAASATAAAAAAAADARDARLGVGRALIGRRVGDATAAKASERALGQDEQRLTASNGDGRSTV